MGIKKFIKKFLSLIGLLPRKPKGQDYHKYICSLEESNVAIRELLNSQKPTAIVRLGSVELQCIAQYYRNRKSKRGYQEITRDGMRINAGFFPATDSFLDKFSQLYIDGLHEIDALGVWYNYNENLIAKKYCPQAELIPLEAIEPYYHKNPWSNVLKNKKVLIIHPFTETIKDQYKKRNLLFHNNDILPDFKLHTLKAVVSLGGQESGFTSWFEALDYMCEEIRKIDFDIAIIGAGAYGLPLSVFVKKIGKKAIHMGGATQILFGIKGARWDQNEFISKLYNDQWVRPSAKERPEGFNRVEKGCYW